ncbi:MAG: hypothetical protein IJD70_01960 [Clostridia bacterium]|nr:hypothetical protein [Clostridia bacterium]
MDLSVKKVRFGKYMGLGAAVAAAIFLFNPDMALVDIFPDFIGYILLALSLRFFRDLSPHFESAWKKFRLLAIITSLKFISFLWVFGGLSNAQERPTMMLLLSFSFSVLEMIWGIPAWRALTEGFIIHSQTAGGEYPLREKKSKHSAQGKNVSVAFRNATVSFMIGKAFFANIAEFAVLSTHSYDDTAFDWYDFIGLFRTVALFAGIVIGVVWLVRALRYFLGIVRDTELVESAKVKYETLILPNTGLFKRRSISSVLGIIVLAALCTPDLYLDNINVIPDVLTALLLVWAFIKLKPYYKNYISGLVFSGLYLAFSVWGAAASYRYVSDAWVAKTWEDPDIFADFISMYPIRVVEAALMFVTFYFALRGVRAIIKEHCGFVPTTMDEAYRTSRLEAIHKEVGAKVTLCLALAVFTAVTGGLYELILSLDNLVSEVWWLLNFAVSLGFFASALYMMSAVGEEVESRYMLD